MEFGRRCLFCGSEFAGQKTSFEHVIPDWLVQEADLKKRKMTVHWRSVSRAIDMNRVGSKVCSDCNEVFGKLEAAVRPVFSKIRDGLALAEAEQELLLLWFDKFRTSLWLWHWQAGRKDFGTSPKFHVAQRIGQKDHVLLIQRYTDQGLMKGMAFDGFSDVFSFTPSALGLLINNISFVTISSDLFLARHLRKIGIKQVPMPDGRVRFEAKAGTAVGPRMEVLGNPLILGRCVMADEWFDAFGLERNGDSFSHRLGLTKAATTGVYQLNSDLSFKDQGPVEVKTFDGKVEANLALAALNRSRAVRLLLSDLMDADYSALGDGGKALEEFECFSRLNCYRRTLPL